MCDGFNKMITAISMKNVKGGGNAGEQTILKIFIYERKDISTFWRARKFIFTSIEMFGGGVMLQKFCKFLEALESIIENNPK